MGKWQTEEPTDDPSLFFAYKDAAIHAALGQPNSPVQQGATVADSSRAFQNYVYGLVMAAGGIEDENCVEDARPGHEYFKCVFERLYEDQCRHIIRFLKDHFIQAGTPTAAWSLALADPLCTIFIATGGKGRGVSHVKAEIFRAGVFKYP